jgi:hypothetical protein
MFSHIIIRLNPCLSWKSNEQIWNTPKLKGVNPFQLYPQATEWQSQTFQWGRMELGCKTGLWSPHVSPNLQPQDLVKRATLFSTSWCFLRTLLNNSIINLKSCSEFQNIKKRGCQSGSSSKSACLPIVRPWVQTPSSTKKIKIRLCRIYFKKSRPWLLCQTHSYLKMQNEYDMWSCPSSSNLVLLQ